jgi:hypothetical protein
MVHAKPYPDKPKEAEMPTTIADVWQECQGTTADHLTQVGGATSVS